MLRVLPPTFFLIFQEIQVTVSCVKVDFWPQLFKRWITLFTLGGGGGYLAKFGRVCAADLSEPLPHYSLFCDQL